MLLRLLAAALASPLVVDVGDEVPVGRNGTWARVHANPDGGWWFFQAAGGSYWVTPLDASLAEAAERTQLNDRTNLQDHAIVRCPDGSFLHVASGSVGGPNDSAWAWRYGADWAVEMETTIEERVPDRAHNDPTLVCGEVATGVGYSRYDRGGGAFFAIGEDGEVARPVEMQVGYFMGASLATWNGALVSANVSGPGGPSIDLQTFDAELQRTGSTPVRVTDGAAFWPQGLLPLADDRLLLAHMVGDPRSGGRGDVWVEVLDSEFRLLESVQVTDDGNAYRPWLAWSGDTVLVSFDRDLQPTLVPLTLDLSGVDGLLEEGGGRRGDDPAGCGCAATSPFPPEGAGVAAGALAALAVRRRRFGTLGGAERRSTRQPLASARPAV